MKMNSLYPGFSLEDVPSKTKCSDSRRKSGIQYTTIDAIFLKEEDMIMDSDVEAEMDMQEEDTDDGQIIQEKVKGKSKGKIKKDYYLFYCMEDKAYVHAKEIVIKEPVDEFVFVQHGEDVHKMFQIGNKLFESDIIALKYSLEQLRKIKKMSKNVEDKVEKFSNHEMTSIPSLLNDRVITSENKDNSDHTPISPKLSPMTPPREKLQEDSSLYSINSSLKGEQNFSSSSVEKSFFEETKKQSLVKKEKEVDLLCDKVFIKQEEEVNIPCDKAQGNIKGQSTNRGRQRSFCIFCNKLIFSLPRHLFSKHYGEDEIKCVIDLPPGDPKRIKKLRQIRYKGMAMHNSRATSLKSMMLPRRQSDCPRFPCPYCKVLLKKRSLYQHVKNCVLSSGRRDTTNVRNLLQSARLELLSNFSMVTTSNKIEDLKTSPCDELKKMITKMRIGKKHDLIVKDELLIDYCNSLCYRYKRDPLLEHHIKQKLTYIIDIFLIIQNKNPEIERVEDIFQPKLWESFISAVKTRAGWDNRTKTFKYPKTVSLLHIAFNSILKHLDSYINLHNKTHIKRDIEKWREIKAERFFSEIKKFAKVDYMRKQYEREKGFKSVINERKFPASKITQDSEKVDDPNGAKHFIKNEQSPLDHNDEAHLTVPVPSDCIPQISDTRSEENSEKVDNPNFAKHFIRNELVPNNDADLTIAASSNSLIEICNPDSGEDSESSEDLEDRFERGKKKVPWTTSEKKLLIETFKKSLIPPYQAPSSAKVRKLIDSSEELKSRTVAQTKAFIYNEINRLKKKRKLRK